MQHTRRDTKAMILAALEQGESVIPAVLEIAEQEQLDAAWVQGIGAVRDVEIGAFDAGTSQYATTCPEGDWELLSLQGNLGIGEDGERVFHPHVVLGDAAGQTVGGHLFRATCAVTVELAMQALEGRLERRIDPDIGLKLWSL